MRTLRAPRRSWLYGIALTALWVPALVAEESRGGFQLALPGYAFEFPRDHGAHPDFATEWWYYTGHLTTASGRRFGFELTFFRVGVNRDPPSSTAWALRNLSLAHFAVSDLTKKRFRYHEKLNRSSPFTADAAVGKLFVFNEGWRAVTLPDGSMHLRADAAGDGIDLVLRTRKKPVIHGVDGISVKAEGSGYASHYYSLTRLAVEGRIRVDGRWESCRGQAWMDHEFGSATLRESQEGWDWFSVQLDDDSELMLYQIRRTDGSPDVTSSGSFITAAGEVIHLRHDQFRVRTLGSWRSKASGARYPMGWEIDVPPLGLRLHLREQLKEQELVTRGSTQVTYWEGAVRATGSFEGTPVTGAGYVEMTGYD